MNNKLKLLKISIMMIILIAFTLFICEEIITIQKNGGITKALSQTIVRNLVNDSETEYVQILNSVGNIIENVKNENNNQTTNITQVQTEEQNEQSNNDILRSNIQNVDLSTDSSLHSIVYNNEELQMTSSDDSTILGQCTINIEPEQTEVELDLTANELATIQVGTASQNGSINIVKNVKVMFDDIYVDITITAENGDSSLYRVIIHKNTYLTGQVLTEGSYSDINVKLISENNEVAKEFTSNDGYIYTSVDTENIYKIEIKKDGYLKHTFTNFKAIYGSKNYFGEIYLLAGEVVGNNEYINLNDLVKMTKKSTKNTVVDDENSKFDFNGDEIIDRIDADALSTNYNKKAPEEEFEIYDAAPVIEDIEAIVEMGSIKLYATVKDESLDKVTFHINGQDIEGTINREEVTATYEYRLDFDSEISLTVEAVDTTEKRTISDEVTIVGNLIRTAEDLVKFSNNVNNKNTYEEKVVNLGADIDISNVEFTSIGNTRLKTFNGTFNGKEHVISNLNSTALFGYTNSAKINKLGLNGTIENQNNHTAIVEYANSTYIDNCFNTTVINGIDNHSVIAENAVDSTITNSYSTYDIIGNIDVGNNIDKCYSTSKVNINDNLLEEIGDAYKPDYYRQLNNGYPILKWQKRIAPFVPALIIDTDEGEYDGETVVEQATNTAYELKEPTKDGCIFDGWTIKNGDGVIEDNIFTFGEEDTIIIANWKGDRLYTIAELMEMDAIKLCDTINYNANNTGIESPYTYEAPLDITGGDDVPVFSSDDYMKWKVYSIDKENNEIEIISTDGTPAKIGLNGNVAFANSLNILENACGVYGHGYGALGARSLTWEDIEKYTTYDKTTYVSGNEYYGKTYKYTTGYHFKAITDENGNIIDYENEMTKATSTNPIIETQVGFIINNAIDYFPEDIGNLLIHDSNGHNRISFLGSRAVSLYSSTFCRFCLRNIYLGNISWTKIGEYNNTSGTSTPVDRYNLIPLVTLDTSVKVRKVSEGVWEIVTPDEMKETKKIKIGDIVNYDAGNTSKVYEYTTKSELTGSTTSATFKSNDQMRWRVLSIDDETNQVELISENGTPNKLSFSGTTGFVNCIDVLNDISSIYGHGLAAVGARSINDDDIGKYSNFDRAAYFRQKFNRVYYGGRKYTSGNIYNEIRDDNNKVIGYEKTTTTATSSNPITMTQTRYICEDAFNTYDYWTASMLVRIVRNYDLDTTRNYWIATQGVDVASTSSPSYGIFYLDSNNINTTSSGSYKVCPVVTLSSKLNFEYNDNGTWDMVYDIYSIRYNLDGGVFNTESPVEYNEFNQDIVIPQPRKEGYVFLGWSEPNSDELVRDIIIPSGSIGDKSYTAHWKKETTYSIEYNLNGGSLINDNPSEYKDSSEDIKLINPKKKDYAFAGWIGTGLEKPTKDVIIPYGSEGNRTYTAIWKEIDSSIYATLYNDGTLVFTNDGRMVNDRTEESVVLNSNITNVTFTSTSSMPWYSKRTTITKIEFVDEVFPTATSYWFYNLTNLQEIKNIENLNMQINTTMYYMFGNCTSLTNLNLSCFDTSNVTNMGYVFYNCTSLTNINLDGFKTNNVTNMSYMFYSCEKATEINISTFEGTNVTGALNMFYNCKALTDLDLSSFGENNITDMSNMFYGCEALTSINLNGFCTSRVTNMSNMFRNCKILTSLDLSSFDTSNVTTMTAMFNGCNELNYLNVSSFNTSNVTEMSSMFYGCKALTDINLNNFNTSNVTSMHSTFYDCKVLTQLDLRSFNTKKVTKMNCMFYGCTLLTKILVGDDWVAASSTSLMFSECGTQSVTNYKEGYADLFVRLYDGSNLVFSEADIIDSTKTLTTDYGNISGITYLSYDTIPWYNVRNSVTSVDFIGNIIPASTQYWFYAFNKLETLNNLANLNTSRVSSMKYMFSGCSMLTNLDLSEFVTDEVKNMSYMFNGCSNLTFLNISSFNTSKVTDMMYMFYNCKLLTSLDLSNFTTNNVTSMSAMFSSCSGLESVNLSSFVTDNVTNMSSMFNGCSTLNSLDLTSFDTNKVTSMYRMFYNCSSMTEIKVSSDKWKKAITITDMFKGCGVSDVTVV